MSRKTELELEVEKLHLTKESFITNKFLQYHILLDRITNSQTRLLTILEEIRQLQFELRNLKAHFQVTLIRAKISKTEVENDIVEESMQYFSKLMEE